MSVILRVGAVKPNRSHEIHYGSGDEAPSSYTDADVLDIPLPEHTYQRPLPPASTSTQTNISLQYQDHNYCMPPPVSPPRPSSPRPLSPFEDNGLVQMEEEVKTSPLVSVVEEVVEDSVTRCICGYLHDDGYMICCDKCSVWQHIDCMGVDRNDIPDSYFCELCQPRILDAVKAKAMQKKKREELAARNVLSDSSATDTDPEEAANALASMGKKLPGTKKKNLKQKRKSKGKDKPPLKMKIRKALAQKVKRPEKKEKENMTSGKPPKKILKSSTGEKIKSEKCKNRLPLNPEQITGDPWNSNFSPWVDSYDYAHENRYNASVKDLSSNVTLVNQAVDISSIMPDKVLSDLVSVAEVKKNRKGLKAMQEIPAGQAVIEYKGKVMLQKDYSKELRSSDSLERFQPFVLFYSHVDVDLCVDARVYGNEARFFRRSCTPNAEVKHIVSQGKLYFVVLSKRDIMCGSEVTIPFDYNYKNCSYCVECACLKNNCAVSRYWKKMKNPPKAVPKDNSGVKRKRQTSGSESNSSLAGDSSCLSPPIGSPRKSPKSPVKATPLSSPPRKATPVKLSNVSTLLAASALLDGQLDLASSFDLDVSDPIHNAQIPALPALPKTSTTSRRSSRALEDSVKEERNTHPLTPTKEKAVKSKDSLKSKTKEKDIKVVEVKKERRLSSRRQSQDDLDDYSDPKVDSSSTAQSSGTETEESVSENQKKMTREERKMEAIMKAFEKMEKRQGKRKEAMTRGDQGTKRSSTDSKIVKKEDSNSQDGFADSNTHIKDEPLLNGDATVKSENQSEASKAKDDQKELATSESDKQNELKPQGKPGGSTAVNSTSAPPSHEARLGSLDSTLKSTRKFGKRKRRRSRAYSTAVVSEATSLSTDAQNTSVNLPPTPLSMPVTPASTPTTTPLPADDVDAGIFKYVKTKKHLFDEWSHKHEDETKQDVFVQYLPNPHVNTMDHLQRRNSQSSGCGIKGSEASGGSAKKRWLRQAMHEVPATVVYNHSLSVTTDSGSASPVHSSSSPNPGTVLGSPGVGSPLDFVTPLKKRRLMRESLSNEATTSPSPGVIADTVIANGVGIAQKTNGVKHMFPSTRHSTDDVRRPLVPSSLSHGL